MSHLCVFSRPNGLIYQKFRNQFLAFSIFQSEYSSPVEEEGPGLPRDFTDEEAPRRYPSSPVWRGGEGSGQKSRSSIFLPQQSFILV